MAKRKSPRWQRPKPQTRQVQIGVTWYTEDQWCLVKAASADSDRFEKTYEDWVAMAEEATKNMHAKGIATERVYVIASELLDWCLAHGKANDAESRSEFVSYVLSRRSDA